MEKTIYLGTRPAELSADEITAWLADITKIVPEERRGTIRVGRRISDGCDGKISFFEVTYDDGREDPKEICKRDGHLFAEVKNYIERTSFMAASSSLPFFCIAADVKVTELKCSRCGGKDVKGEMVGR